MAFDEARYRREVLDAGLPVGDDLRRRYQLPQRLTGPEVTEAVQAARACWRRNRSRLKYRAVIEELEAGHLLYQPLFDAAGSGDLEPLRAALADQGRRREAGYEQLVAALKEAADGLGLIAPATVREVSAAHGAGEAKTRGALDILGISVADPDRLPGSVPHPAYARCARQLAVLRLRHLADFLAVSGPGERTTTPVRPLTGPAPGARELDAAARRWGRLPHSAAQTAAQAVVAAARKVLSDQGPEGLREILRHELAVPLRERRAARAGAGSLLTHAVRELSVAPPDARRLVFAVLHEQATDPITDRLRALVAGGLLAEAGTVADRVPEGTLPEEAAALVAHVRTRLSEAIGLRDRAGRLRGTDPDRAWALLDRAESLATDLPGADDLRRSLAARPVPRITATPDRTGVLVEWEPTPSTAGEPQYVLVRRTGRAPRSVADGTTLALPTPGATSLLDTDVPVNVPVHYGVAVRRAAEPDGPLSPFTVGGPVQYRPEVTAAVLRADDGVVIGSWRCPAQAESVRVTRISGPDGPGSDGDGDGGDDGGSARPVTARGDGFTDQGLPNSVAHRYRIQAVYREADGTAVATEGVWLTATPLAPPEPVTALRIEPVPDDGTLYQVRFEAPPAFGRQVPPGGEVRLYAFDGPLPPWPVGRRLRTTELASRGTALTVHQFDGGLRFQPPSRSAVILAVTVAGGRAVAGARELLALVPELHQVKAVRGRAEVVVTFDWPPDEVTEAELSWGVPGRPPQRRTVTRTGYLHEAGARLPIADGAAVEIEVRPVGTAGGLRALGAPVRTTLPARIDVAYTLARTGLPGRRSVRAVFTSATAVRIPRLLIVKARGTSWPLAPGDGETLAELIEAELGPGRPARLTAPLPRGRGYWLRCFAVGAEADDGAGAGDAVVLLDPPPRELQVR